MLGVVRVFRGLVRGLGGLARLGLGLLVIRSWWFVLGLYVPCLLFANPVSAFCRWSVTYCFPALLVCLCRVFVLSCVCVSFDFFLLVCVLSCTSCRFGLFVVCLIFIFALFLVLSFPLSPS